MKRKLDMEQRKPGRIIGDDAYTQLIFEGYDVVPAELIRDLADCLEDMTKHYVEVRDDLYGFEARDEIEVIAARKLIEQARFHKA
jgi:hypothetical protein